MPMTAKNFPLKQFSIILYSNIVIFFDFLIYFYLADTLSDTFFPSTQNTLLIQLQTFGIFAAGYLARPLGGYVLGRYGDGKGRKPAFMVSASFIATTSLITACLPTYAQVGILAPILFLIIRIVQGMGFGAHSALSWVFIGEHAPSTKRGLYLGAVSASFLLGVLVTVFVFKGLFDRFSIEDLGNSTWRSVFISSSAFCFIAVILISYLRETPIFKQEQLQNAERGSTEIVAESSGAATTNRFHAIFLSSLLSFYLASMFIMVALALPQLVLMRFSVDASMLMAANVIGVFFFILGTLFYGLLSDKGNLGRVLMIGSVIPVIQMFAFYYSLQYGGADYVLIMYALLGFTAGVVSLCPIIMLQLFPTQNRLTSISVIYNGVYAIVGGVLPALLVYATTQVSFTPALYMAFLGFIGFITGFYIYRLPTFRPLQDI